MTTKHKGSRNSLAIDRDTFHKNVTTNRYNVNAHTPIGYALAQYFAFTSTNSQLPAFDPRSNIGGAGSMVLSRITGPIF